MDYGYIKTVSISAVAATRLQSTFSQRGHVRSLQLKMFKANCFNSFVVGMNVVVESFMTCELASG